MAKKHSSKTATQEAIKNSEPRVNSYRGWQGVNFVDAPLTWEPLETGRDKFRETDLPPNYLMVQNNLVTTDTKSLETRRDSELLGTAPDGYRFTGVAGVYRHWLFCVARSTGQAWHEKICYKPLGGSSWTDITVRVGDVDDPIGVEVCEIGFYEGNLVATARDLAQSAPVGLLLLARMDVDEEHGTLEINGVIWSGSASPENRICDTPKAVDRPTVDPSLEAVNMKFSDKAHGATTDAPIRVEVKYCYTNRLGSTLCQTDSHCATLYVEISPALWTTGRFVRVRPGGAEDGEVSSITGIDLYGREGENLDWVFIGHVNVTPAQVRAGTWYYNWYGNMTDISQWLTSQLMVPTDNTTHGPDATHFSCHDSRMYYWGMESKPYRLWIGGNPGSEFSVARGLGGAWVDIEPGSGFDVKGTEKWKTTSGANIVTIMCGNRNTTKVKRFNLVETNLTLSNEIQYKSYMYEEVSNVVGCNSRWGHGVYSDGLYSLSRYGLMLTTMAMEYNSQMRNQCMSDVIDPIFTERIGKRISDGRMVCIDEVIYIVLSEESGHDDEPVPLDNVILCYDVNLKAWYTWTHDQDLTSPDSDKVLHVFAVDSDEYEEGLGVVTGEQVRLYPVTGIQQPVPPDFQVLVETGELVPRLPAQAFWYVQQLELRFDYFISDPDEEDAPPTVLVEGVDYYGRQFQIEKRLNKNGRRWQTENDNGKGWDEDEGEWTEQREHVEWIRIDKYVESFRLRIKGKARFRLTHINAKMYQQSDTIGTPYGFDARDTYHNRRGGKTVIHHYIDDYNNLRRAVVS